jgi:hypothetical protein
MTKLKPCLHMEEFRVMYLTCNLNIWHSNFIYSLENHYKQVMIKNDMKNFQLKLCLCLYASLIVVKTDELQSNHKI